MKTLTQISSVQAGIEDNKGFAVDTTFVLFFLAVELGQTFSIGAFDSLLLTITLLMVLVLPYFLSLDEKYGLMNWILGRSFITALALTLGVMYKQTLGVVLPETFRFLPMTLLIVTAMISCYLQFYGFFKLRLAK
jgi:hypothetical protein